MSATRIRGEKHWMRQQALALAVSALLLLLVFESSRLDLWLTAQVYDPGLPGFPWQHHPFFDQFMHHGLKSASYAFAAFSLVLCVFAWRGRLSWLPAAHARFLAAAILLIPLSTTLLKKLSGRHCPWDVLDFGGFAPYVSLLERLPTQVVPGACFPAGHASAGFVWLAWGFALLGVWPQRGRLIIVAALVLGAAMGGGRILQGAHFLSHVLWSAWWSWALCLLLLAVTGVRVPGRPVGVGHLDHHPGRAPTISPASAGVFRSN